MPHPALNDAAAVGAGFLRLSLAARSIRASQAAPPARSSPRTSTSEPTPHSQPRNAVPWPHHPSSTARLSRVTPRDPAPSTDDASPADPPSRPIAPPSTVRQEPQPETPPRLASSGDTALRDDSSHPEKIQPADPPRPSAELESRGAADDSPSEPLQAAALRSSKVPSSRLARLMHYGGLAAGLGWGMASEALRRSTVSADPAGPQPGLLLSEANIERLVDKLSKMRGAALKLGQFLSIQDTKLLPPQLEAVLHRVQNSAHYMPEWQTERVLVQDLGPDWRDHFEAFDMRPFAAASIGQVHSGTLSSTSPLAARYGSSLRVAVKVQFPGVRQSISSDLANLKWLLLASSVLPRGLYLDNSLSVLERELVDECDYEREAVFGQRMRDLIGKSSLSRDFVVPQVVDELCGPMVLTTEMMEGKPLKCVLDGTQEERDWLGARILDLCLHELCDFRVMQTDPNWSNFLFNDKTKKIELIDFGASREYSSDFIDKYKRLLSAAIAEDREQSIAVSRELGYLTGEENEAMRTAHVGSLFALATPFRPSSPSPFPFGELGPVITSTVRSQIPIMLKHRLTPPPEETYSLNRKLSGAFLLCERLKSSVPAQALYLKRVSAAQGV
ncbi:hypothetical protein JCM10212_005945 [Sporobolomyces blumeae]